MNTLQEALTALERAGIAEDGSAVHRFAVGRLNGDDTSTTGDARLEVSSADVLIPLLDKVNSASVPSSVRAGIIDAWKDVYAGAEGWIRSKSQDSADPRRAWVSRLCRVAELTYPEELHSKVRDMLSEALANPEMAEAPKYEILSAWRAYPPDRLDWDIVVRLLEERRFAAAAFSILVSIDPRDSRLGGYFRELCRRRFMSKWKTDVLYLALGWRDALGGGIQPIIRTFRELHSETLVWDSIYAELIEQVNSGMKWAEHWLRAASLLQPPNPPFPTPVTRLIAGRLTPIIWKEEAHGYHSPTIELPMPAYHEDGSLLIFLSRAQGIDRHAGCFSAVGRSPSWTGIFQ